MIARGLLMIEHRLIEKMLVLSKTKVDLMTKENYNAVIIDSIVDFIKMYADRTHHGKEEDILLGLRTFVLVNTKKYPKEAMISHLYETV